ncbi:hypothetical protein Rhopal_001275-T1 [Rhodotorula paludigena]|uniref:Presequence translocated-associated motor subunit PAM17 n=1 Tax=Rhodotorula paludigena TaxID=86838 RepID=A0AAV5G751_9BASI|nr:hypothetical protein Rhopal_001275-T1 [Rhodotorula paludigena]
MATLRSTLAPALRASARPRTAPVPSPSSSSSLSLPRRLASSEAKAAQPSTAADVAAARTLDWPSYLALRRSQRLYGLVASVPTTLIGFTAGAGYFATIESDPTNTIMGFEPVIIYGAATLGCVALGWLSGPTIGGALWRLTHRNVAKAMEAKDKDFFRHISRWRADPTRQSAANPSPDYYAEKVGSLRQYRTWLRDQATFRRKAQFGSGDEAVY